MLREAVGRIALRFSTTSHAGVGIVIRAAITFICPQAKLSGAEENVIIVMECFVKHFKGLREDKSDLSLHGL